MAHDLVARDLVARDLLVPEAMPNDPLFDLVDNVVTDYVDANHTFDCNPLSDDVFRLYLQKHGEPHSLWSSRRMFEFGLTYLAVCRAVRDEHEESIGGDQSIAPD